MGLGGSVLGTMSYVVVSKTVLFRRGCYVEGLRLGWVSVSINLFFMGHCAVYVEGLDLG